MSGSQETTVKQRDSKARDKSCDGNACHIDEATPREVRNGVSSISCLPMFLLGAPTPIFTAINCLVFLSLCLRLFILPNLPVFHSDCSSLYFSTLSTVDTIHLSPLSLSISSLKLSKLFSLYVLNSRLFPVKGNEARTKHGLFKTCLCSTNI